MGNQMSGRLLPHAKNVESAKLFLAECFEDRSHFLAMEIMDKGQQNGFSVVTLRRAKKELGIESVRYTHCWYWVKRSEKQNANISGHLN